METKFEIDLPSLRYTMGLTHTEARVVQLLMQEETATHEQLILMNTRVRQLMYSIRGKLKRYNLTIISDREIGYSLPLKDKLRIKNLIDGAIVNEMYKANKIEAQVASFRKVSG
jgi:hypothetical protein